MDSNDHRRRQSNPSGYASQQGLIPQSSPQYPPSSVPDRFRQSHLGVQSSTSAPTAGRSGAGGIPSYNYPYGEGAQFGSSSMTAGPMQYQAEYGQDPPRPPQQSYQGYGSNIMYSVPGQQQASPQSPYEAVQPYPQPRQSSAIEVLSTQFGVPQNYYVAGEGGPTSAPVPAIGGQNASSTYNQISYTNQTPAGRDSISSAYASGMADSNQASQSSAYTQPPYGAAELDNAYGQYQAELKRTFESIRDGRLAEAGNSLVSISEWLLGNAEVLGLVRDDENMHADRIKLWEQFNTAWLAALQTQREMTLEVLDTGQRPAAPRSLMQVDQMENMGKELVRLCDIMEKHGLVDYQMGVWEEEIITLLNNCIDLLDEDEAPRAPPTQRRR